ncbi:COQ7-domain-containing protein [Teratosphaeria nubilosa]|uniref:5-demethoxyubiquinone hydroxylase, mitochondrial n=1 Tax=Teratosphaeria nubilosa TaxID=161662 RepID=A0A6G1KX14_9PEZI|nr:COQ7-domain-containing protein [Teratosphaeria nubilosa]
MSPCLPLRSRLSPLAFQLRARSHVVQSRTIVSSSASPSTEPQPDSLNQPQPKRRKPLSAEQRKFLDSALRVNHAGELAATLIYTAQSPPIKKAYPHLRPLMKQMYDQEAGHFRYFNKILAEHRIRPTAMYPVWHAAATFLGWSTGILGREAAMACTEAVETEIGEHYNGQVRELLAWMKDMEERGEDVGDELRGLIKEIRRIRDEELEHLDHAVQNDAKEANPYELLTGVIRYGCKGAIAISERI